MHPALRPAFQGQLRELCPAFQQNKLDWRGLEELNGL
jgi:hypothetical protein